MGAKVKLTYYKYLEKHSETQTLGAKLFFFLTAISSSGNWLVNRSGLNAQATKQRKKCRLQKKTLPISQIWLILLLLKIMNVSNDIVDCAMSVITWPGDNYHRNMYRTSHANFDIFDRNRATKPQCFNKPKPRERTKRCKQVNQQPGEAPWVRFWQQVRSTKQRR